MEGTRTVRAFLESGARHGRWIAAADPSTLEDFGQMRKTLADREHWARVAGEWVAWARSPNHDAFWAYRKSLITFIGAGDGEVLDLGCGEGRVSRELKALGYQVTASDAVVEMIEAAVDANSAHHYAVADAAALPFRNNGFDLVVLMDVEDVPGTLKEIRRVMRPNGELVVSLVHPFRDRGDFASAEPDAPFVLRGTYFGRQRFEGSEQRNGLRMPGRNRWKPTWRLWRGRG